MNFEPVIATPFGGDEGRGARDVHMAGRTDAGVDHHPHGPRADDGRRPQQKHGVGGGVGRLVPRLTNAIAGSVRLRAGAAFQAAIDQDPASNQSAASIATNNSSHPQCSMGWRRTAESGGHRARPRRRCRNSGRAARRDTIQKSSHADNPKRLRRQKTCSSESAGEWLPKRPGFPVPHCLKSFRNFDTLPFLNFLSR